MPGCKTNRKRLVGVTAREHGGEPRNLFLAASHFTRLFVSPFGAHGAQGAFAIQPFLQPAQRLVYRFALFEFDLSQLMSLPFQTTSERMVVCALSGQGRGVYDGSAACQRGTGDCEQAGLHADTVPGSDENAALYICKDCAYHLYKCQASWRRSTHSHHAATRH